jgi:hypothetical protein
MKGPQEKEHALKLLEALLKSSSAQELTEDVDEIFFGYLSSDVSENTTHRIRHASTYFKLQRFLKKVSYLKSINRWTN